MGDGEDQFIYFLCDYEVPNGQAHLRKGAMMTLESAAKPRAPLRPVERIVGRGFQQ